MSVSDQKISNEPDHKDILDLKKLINSNQFSIAEKKAKELIIKYPNSFNLLNLLGVSLIEQNKLAEAKTNYIELIKTNPSFAEAHNNLANIYIKENKIEEAIFYLEKAIANKHDLTQAHLNLAKIYIALGNSLQIKSDIEASVKNYKKAIEYKSDSFEAHNNLGIALIKLNKVTEAINSFENAIKIKSDYYEAHNNLGNVLNQQEKIEDAIKSYQKAISIKPDYLEAYNNLGTVFDKIENFDQAIENYKHAIKIKPDFTKAYNNLAASLVRQGRFDEAIKNYNKVLELEPNKAQYAINAKLLIPTIPESNKHLNLWREKFNSAIDQLKKNKFVIKDPQKTINPPTFNLAYSNLNNLEIIKKVSNFFRDAIPVINFQSKEVRVQSKKDNRIKVGFISQFFTDHTIGKLYKGLIDGIDKKKFELIVFHTSNSKRGIIKKEIDKSAEKVINLFGDITFQQKQIENEMLDIVFFPDIGMASSTYFLAHARLAPVQIASWGHPETSGISTMDYFLSSSLMESKNAASFYSERLICLDRIFLNFIPPNIPDKKLSRVDFDIPENKNLYSCPQTLFKIHPDFDKVLAKIVEKDLDAQIIMIATKHKAYVEKLKKRWSTSYSALNQKVKFVKNMSLERFLSLIEVSDVLLDPLYFGGGLSFAESMVVGTPTITMPNEFMRSSITAGAYKQMKIKNPPIVDNIDDYVKLAIDLAKDKKKNFDFRNLLKKAAKLYLFNDQNAVKKFEKFLLEANEASKKNSYLKSGHTIS